MNLKKVTIRIVFTFLAAIALGSMIASCSNEEFEGPRLTLATRSTNNSGEPPHYETPTDTIEPVDEFIFFIPDLIHENGVQFEFCVSWTEGACNRPGSGKQSAINVLSHRQVGTENIYEIYYRSMMINDDETGENSLSYIITNNSFQWSENFLGATAVFDYKIISPKYKKLNKEKNIIEEVRDTIGPLHVNYPFTDARIGNYVKSPMF